MHLIIIGVLHSYIVINVIDKSVFSVCVYVFRGAKCRSESEAVALSCNHIDVTH